MNKNYLGVEQAKAIVRQVGGESLVRRLERGEEPNIDLLSPISPKEQESLKLAIKTVHRAHGFI